MPYVTYFYHETNIKYVSYRLREIDDLIWFWFWLTFPISTFICLWAIYLFRRSICLFCWRKYVDRSWEYLNSSQTHECRNWDWGRAISTKGLGIHKRDFRCTVPWQSYNTIQYNIQYTLSGWVLNSVQVLPKTKMHLCRNISTVNIRDTLADRNEKLVLKTLDTRGITR